MTPRDGSAASKRLAGIRTSGTWRTHYADSHLPDGCSIGAPSSLPSHFLLCTVKEVQALLSRTSHTTASGPDDIPGALIAWAAEVSCLRQRDRSHLSTSVRFWCSSAPMAQCQSSPHPQEDWPPR